MDAENLLNAIAFVFTVGMVLYGLVNGFSTIELVINLLYFSVLLILHLKILQRTVFPRK